MSARLELPAAAVAAVVKVLEAVMAALEQKWPVGWPVQAAVVAGAVPLYRKQAVVFMAVVVAMPRR